MRGSVSERPAITREKKAQCGPLETPVETHGLVIPLELATEDVIPGGVLDCSESRTSPSRKTMNDVSLSLALLY
jgi:hypothetical protein